MTIAFVVLSCLSAVTTFFALVAPRRPAILGFYGWMLGLVPIELPFACIGWNVFLLVFFGALGAIDSAVAVAAAVLIALSIVGDVVLARRSAAAGDVVARALRDALGADYEQQIAPALAASVRKDVPLRPVLLKPFLARRRDVTKVRNIAYGPAGKENRLDVYHHETLRHACPVLVHVHGGAWTHGKKDNQGQPILYHFASRGWLCVAPNYRLCPAATFPDALIDVKRVIAWVRQHAHEYGGDPAQLYMTGGSAGGHLTALAALTPCDPAFQPGFEDIDTTITAAMPLYGDYDWLDTYGERAKRHLDRSNYFAKKIVKCTAQENRAVWEQGSPLYHVRAVLVEPTGTSIKSSTVDSQPFTPPPVFQVLTMVPSSRRIAMTEPSSNAVTTRSPTTAVPPSGSPGTFVDHRIFPLRASTATTSPSLVPDSPTK
jgi:acetyl esterase/lipase